MRCIQTALTLTGYFLNQYNIIPIDDLTLSLKSQYIVIVYNVILRIVMTMSK